MTGLDYGIAGAVLGAGLLYALVIHVRKHGGRQLADFQAATTNHRHDFVDPITGLPCALVIPVGGRLFASAGIPKIGIAHPDCDSVAHLTPECDAFYCVSCRHNGRISGAWAIAMIEASGVWR